MLGGNMLNIHFLKRDAPLQMAIFDRHRQDLGEEELRRRCRTFLEVAMRPASFPANDRIGCCSFQWIGLGENLQENPIFNGKNHGFL